MRIFTWKRAAAAAMLCLVLSGGNSVPLVASDHADPTVLREPDANITDLFFFPDGDRYVVILDVHRALTANPPYDLPQYEYRINFDWHTGVSFVNGDADTVRYGGKIAHPADIKEDATIKIRLNADATVMGQIEYTGLQHTDQFKVFTGVRADPFIFPRFFKKNAIAMVFSLPKNAFPPDRDTFLLWAAAFKGDKQVDHVGRSNRTQQARFERLNTLHPSKHLAQIMEDMTFWDKWVGKLNAYRETAQVGAAIQILLQIRSKNMYDFAPDVMVYSDARERDPNLRPGFPNGRHIQDDVAGITCAEGDCILQELAFVEGGWPRQKISDRPVPTNATFPYLLEPYKEGEYMKSAATPLPRLSPLGVIRLVPLLIALGPRLIGPLPPSLVITLIVVAVILLFLLWLVIQGIKYRLLLRRQRAVI